MIVRSTYTLPSNKLATFFELGWEDSHATTVTKLFAKTTICFFAVFEHLLQKSKHPVAFLSRLP